MIKTPFLYYILPKMVVMNFFYILIIIINIKLITCQFIECIIFYYSCGRLSQ